MAMKAKRENKDKNIKAKTIQEKYSTIIFTEKVFSKMMIKANAAGLIKLSNKQLNNMKGFVGVMSANPTQRLLHSSDNSHGKIPLLISCGDHQSPLQQQNDSSARINQVVRQLDVAERLTLAESKLYGNVSGKMYAYMLTLTRPNSHKGNLNADYTKHRSRISKLLKALKDGAINKNGVQLVDGSYLGALASHELTLSDTYFKKDATRSIYHPHTHILILADAPLNEDATFEVLMDKWRALNSNLSLSKDGNDFKACYDPNSVKNSPNVQKKAIKEAVKYTVKPENWNRVSDVHDSYMVEVFAEMYNAIKGKKLKQSHGLLETASNFISTFGDFENAFSFTIMDEFPDIVTQMTELVFDKAIEKKGGYKAVYGRELTLDEVLFYNYGLVEETLISSDLEYEIELFFDKYEDYFTTRKQLLYADVFKSFVFARTIDEVKERLERFAQIEDSNNKLKAYDIRLFANAFDDGVFEDILCVEAVSHVNFLRAERVKYVDLFDKHVAPLSGSNATESNHEMVANFLDQQHLNVNTSRYYKSGGGSSYGLRVELFVDGKIEDAESYFGIRFFGDDWNGVKYASANGVAFVI